MALDGPTLRNAWPFDVSLQFPEDQTATFQPGAAGQNRDALVEGSRQIQGPEQPRAAQDGEGHSGQTPTTGDDPLVKALVLNRLHQSTSALGGPLTKGGPGNVLFWKPGGGVAHASAPTKRPVTLAGSKLGVNGKGEDIRVKREVGSREGYGERWQAIAAARMAGAEPAAVVRGVDGHFHAVELTAGVDPKFAAANPTRSVKALPSSAEIADAQKRVKELSTRLDQLYTGKQTNAVSDEEDGVRAELAKANLHWASVVLGAPESDIRLSTFAGREPGVINITPHVQGDNPGSHGPAPGQGDEFGPDVPSAIRIRYSELNDPGSAQQTLFHEVEHQANWHLAQRWAQTYQQETGRTFVAGPELKYFASWMQKQTAQNPPRLSKADADLVVDVAGNFNGMTEAAANIRSVEMAFQVGRPDLAAKALMDYAAGLTPRSKGGLGAYGTPVDQSQFMQGVQREIRGTYRELTPDLQRKFEDAVAAVNQKYPDAWVSKLKLK